MTLSVLRRIKSKRVESFMLMRRLETGMEQRSKNAGILPLESMRAQPDQDDKSWPTGKTSSRAQMATAAVLSLLTGGLYPRQAE
jgi:hypothetical protein